MKSITELSNSKSFVRPHSRKSSSPKTAHVCYHCGVSAHVCFHPKTAHVCYHCGVSANVQTVIGFLSRNYTFVLRVIKSLEFFNSISEEF